MKPTIQALEQEQQLAAKLQTRLLPPQPTKFAGLELNYFWQPASYVSGDWIDTWSVAPDWQFFYVADVVGSGAPAALLTPWLKSSLRNLSLALLTTNLEPSPALICAALNQQLLELGANKHLTLTLGCWQASTQKLKICVAGHLPQPLILGELGWFSVVQDNLALGLFPNASYKDYTCTLPVTGKLVCASDGVLELMSAQGSQAQLVAWHELVSSSNGQLEELVSGLGNLPQPWPDDVSIMTLNGC